jgi:hypothetical protein
MAAKIDVGVPLIGWVFISSSSSIILQGVQKVPSHLGALELSQGS